MRAALLAPGRRRAATLLARGIAVAVLAGALLAMLGPFGSYTNGGPVRLLGYWIGAMLLGLPLYGAGYAIAAKATAGAPRWSWPALIAATLLASIPEAWVTHAAAFRLWPELRGAHLSAPLWFAQTATVGVVAMVGMRLILRRAASASRDRPAPPPSARNVDRLGGEVLALQMEDHYVRVHRPGGSELVLMPLGRAIDAMQRPGLRTHRSWWVARHAVAAVEGDARAMRLRLSNGLVAPVARSAVTHLKAAGWIAER